MSCGVHAEAEGFVKRWLAVVATHSGLLLDDPLLGGDVHHVELHVKICGRAHECHFSCIYFHINTFANSQVCMLLISFSVNPSTVLNMGFILNNTHDFC